MLKQKSTVVSITPVALQRDSRTLKMAASFVRLGYRSIVVERLKSDEKFDSLGIEVISANHLTPQLPGAELVKGVTSRLKIFLKFLWQTSRSIGLGALNDSLSYWEFKRQFKKDYSLDQIKIPDGDVYFFHSYEFVDYALKLKKGVKIVYDAHDFYQDINPLDNESMLVRRWIMPFRWRVEQKLINCCNAFLTVSPGLEKKYQSVSGKRPDILLNAHDRRNDEVTDKNIRTFLGLGPDSIIVCCVGNKKRGMVFDQLISVFSKTLKHMYLVFIGNGYEVDENQYVNIHSIPALNPNKLIPFIKFANMGIVPYFGLTENYKFALPNGFFQMIAGELPLVFSQDLGEIKQLNSQLNFGIAEDISQEEGLIKAVREIEENYLEYKKNVILAAEKLSWLEEEKKLQLILESL